MEAERQHLLSSAQRLCESSGRIGIPGVADLAGETFDILKVSFRICRDDGRPLTFQTLRRCVPIKRRATGLLDGFREYRAL
jgi:hypothetical protein